MFLGSSNELHPTPYQKKRYGEISTLLLPPSLPLLRHGSRKRIWYTQRNIFMKKDNGKYFSMCSSAFALNFYQ